MEKIKNFMQKISGDYKILIKKFPITMLIIFVVTLVAAIWVGQDFSIKIEEVLEKFFLFSGIWVLGTFFSETVFQKKMGKNISYIITAIISVCFVQVIDAGTVENLTIKLFITYMVVLSTISIYKSITNAGLTFEEYTLKIFKDFLNSSIVYVILNVGVLLLTVIFAELILDGEYGDMVPRILILLFGGFYAPSIIYVISSINQSQENGFVKGLVTKVLLPLVIAAVGIIYLYIAKIIILQDMPKNVIFRILAGIFVVAFPVWNMAKNYREEKPILNQIVKVLPYLYIPFVLLEIYSIGVRIADYGITEARYFSCIFIILQIIILFLEIYKKGENISQIYIIFAIIGTITILGPLSVDKVSNRSQRKIFEKIFPAGTNFQELTKEEKERVQDVYRYLKYSINGEKYIPEYISEETKEKIDNYYEYAEKEYYNEYDNFYATQKLDLDISGYSRITEIGGIYSTNSKIKVRENQVDISNLVQEIAKRDKKDTSYAKTYFYQNNIIKINDMQDFYISEISVRYCIDTNELDYLNLEGYLLEK